MDLGYVTDSPVSDHVFVLQSSKCQAGVTQQRHHKPNLVAREDTSTITIVGEEFYSGILTET